MKQCRSYLVAPGTGLRLPCTVEYEHYYVHQWEEMTTGGIVIWDGHGIILRDDPGIFHGATTVDMRYAPGHQRSDGLKSNWPFRVVVGEIDSDDE